MRLIDLNPEWVDVKHYDRKGTGVKFDCPCGCGNRLHLKFENPLDGEGRIKNSHYVWRRTGDIFETLSLYPSICRKCGCGWKGHLTDGELVAI